MIRPNREPFRRLAILLANALYLDYFVAIGAVAESGDDSGAIGFKAFAASLENAGALANDAQAKTFARASADVVDAYLSARRRRAVRDFASPNGKGSRYVELLATSLVGAASIHARSLDDERDAIESFYQSGLAFVNMSSGVDAIDSHVAAESSGLASVAAKRAAIGRYVDAVCGLRASYAAFSASIASGNPASSQALVYQFATQLTTDASSLVGAFRATKTDP